MRTWLWFGAAALAVTLAAPAAQAQPRGSYLQSCTNVQTSGGRDPQLSAVCTDMRGRQQFTSLRIAGCVGDIGNNNGQLVCQGGRPGDVTQPGWNGGGGSGWNGDGHGSNQGASGWNGDGQGWSQGGGPGPRGSYLQSCTNVRAGGGLLRATCKDMRGRWQASTLNYSRCVGDIGNNNGQLVCSVGVPGGGSGWNSGGLDHPHH